MGRIMVLVCVRLSAVFLQPKQGNNELIAAGGGHHEGSRNSNVIATLWEA